MACFVYDSSKFIHQLIWKLLCNVYVCGSGVVVVVELNKLERAFGLNKP